MKNENDEIAEEIMKEEEARILAEYAPKQIQRTQVKAAKIAWMFVAVCIDIATAYVVYLMTTWWYAVIWLLAAAGGLLFAEWLWERVGNNDEQENISRISKNVSAAAVLIMGLFSGVAYIMGWTNSYVVENIVLIVTLSLFGFHGWQAYQYHEKDDDYIAATEDARAEAKNLKDIRVIHRAGMRVRAKKLVRNTGSKYEKEHGSAFVAAAGRSYASEAEQPPNSQGGERK